MHCTAQRSAAEQLAKRAAHLCCLLVPPAGTRSPWLVMRTVRKSSIGALSASSRAQEHRSQCRPPHPNHKQPLRSNVTPPITTRLPHLKTMWKAQPKPYMTSSRKSRYQRSSLGGSGVGGVGVGRYISDVGESVGPQISAPTPFGKARPPQHLADHVQVVELGGPEGLGQVLQPAGSGEVHKGYCQMQECAGVG